MSNEEEDRAERILKMNISADKYKQECKLIKRSVKEFWADIYEQLIPFDMKLSFHSEKSALFIG